MFPASSYLAINRFIQSFRKEYSIDESFSSLLYILYQSLQGENSIVLTFSFLSVALPYYPCYYTARAAFESRSRRPTGYPSRLLPVSYQAWAPVNTISWRTSPSSSPASTSSSTRTLPTGRPRELSSVLGSRRETSQLLVLLVYQLRIDAAPPTGRPRSQVPGSYSTWAPILLFFFDLKFEFRTSTVTAS